MAKWNLPEGKIYTQADLDAAVAAALREAADVAGRFYAKGQVTKPEDILAMIPDAGAALDRALAAALERAFHEGFDMAAGLTPHVHEVMQRKDEAWRKSRAIRAQGDK